MSRSIALGLALLGALVVVLFVWRSPAVKEREEGPRAKPAPLSRQESSREPVPAEPWGEAVECTVAWPDGRPVEEFAIGCFGAFLPRAECFSGGAFSLFVPSSEAFIIEVRAKGKGIEGHAHASGVRPDAGPLALVLQTVPTFELRGTVADENGAALERFTVRARRGMSESLPAELDGARFVLSGLVAGEWHVDVGASAHQAVAQTILVGPRTTNEARFVLGAPGHVLGRVLDELGQPVAGACLRGQGIAFGGRTGCCNTSDGQGRFALLATSARPRLRATKSGHAASAELELELSPGETLANVEPRLRASCALTGHLEDKSGASFRRRILVQSSDSAPVDVLSDAHGRFTLDDLSPGPARILASAVPTSLDAAMAMLDAENPERWMLRASAWPGLDFFARAPLELVELHPGQPSTIELCISAPEIVRVRGRIAREGQPVVGSILWSGEGFLSFCQSGPDGRFEATLQRPGTWRAAIGVCAWPEVESLRRFEVTIPEHGAQELELALDTLPLLDSLDDLWR